MRAVPSAPAAQKFEQRKAEARAAWEKHVREKEIDERLKLHRALARGESI